MKFCSKCGAQCDDNAVFCAACGNSFDASKQSAAASAVNYDHTAEFDAKDVSEGKVYAMICYLMGAIGVIIAQLAAEKSDYLRFHIRQALKLSIVQTLLGICIIFLAWTIIVPIVGAICMIIVLVLQIIAFFQICAGKSKEPAIIRSLSFLK